MRVTPVEEVTVRTLLAEPELRGLNLVAGRSAIDRPIRAVTVMDTPYIATWLKGGELVLGSGFFLVEPMRDLDLIRTLADAGAVGLGVKLRHFGGGLSPEAMDAAESRRLAVLEVPADWGWTGIIDWVHRAIGRQEAAILDLARRSEEHFLGPLFRGASPADLAGDLAATLRRPVALVDAPLGRVIELARLTGWPGRSIDEPLLDEVRAAVSAGKGESVVIRAETAGRTWSGSRLATSLGSVLLVPVKGRDRVVSFILVLEGTEPLLRESVVLIVEAAVVIALRAQSEFGRSGNEERAAFLFSVLAGDRAWTPETAVASRYYGWDLEAPHTAFVCQIDISASDLDAAARETETRILAAAPGAIVGRRGDLVFGLLPAPEVESRRVAAVARLERARESLGEGPRNAVTIGVGRLSRTPDELHDSFSLAEQALQLSLAFFGPGRVSGIDELAPYHLIWSIREAPGCKEIVDRVLGPVLGSPDDLVGTLETYLETGAKAKEAAAKLYVHRNTLRSRLTKIGHLTGLDPREPRERFLLELLLLVHKVVQSGGPREREE